MVQKIIIKKCVIDQLFALATKMKDILSQTKHIFEVIVPATVSGLLLKKLVKYHLKCAFFDQNWI